MLAKGKVRHVGDPVAVVIAETLLAARDAAEAVEVEYDPLPAVTDMAAALKPGAPQLFDEVKNNQVVDWVLGDPAKAKAAFAKARHVVSLDLVNNRIVVASMEARAALADYDPKSQRFTLYSNTQGAHLVKGLLANVAFQVAPEKVHVITPDVGGGFGMKLFLYAEHVLTCYAARKLGRPVKWVGERSDAFVSDTHGRDNVSTGRLALDADGKFLGLHVTTLANFGAYLSTFAPFIPTVAGTRVLSVVYRIPAIVAEVKGVLTNTVPVDAYRGAGRPEANYLVERLVDRAAAELGLAPDELRRRNFIPPSAMPYDTGTGLVYDSGEFAENLKRAMQAAGWSGFAERQKAARARNKRRGIGIGCYLEATAGNTEERVEIKFAADGMVNVLVGTQSTGQGHETAYMQLVADRLGVPFDRIKVIQGDSDLIKTGGGTGGARSLYSEGGAILGASEQIITKGKLMAGHLLEAPVVDIEFDAGSFRIAGTDRAIGIIELAKAAQDPAKRPPGMEQNLDGEFNMAIGVGTFPNGCHIAEVEVDEGTGKVDLVGYTVVDDMGKVINPMIVEGQVHGGIAQGVGQALLEHTVYDETGQLLSGSFMDYCLPRADDMPAVRFQLHEVPCTTNPLGVKGAGEAGTVGAAPSVINAVINALQDLGVRNIDMPATPERVWQAMQAARRA